MEQEIKDVCIELLPGYNSRNVGPVSKELFLLQALEEFKNKNHLISIFYQQRALFQTCQDFYLQERIEHDGEQMQKEAKESNCDIETQLHLLKLSFVGCGKIVEYKSCDYLFDITDPVKGAKKIEDVCQEFPKEWTILQLVKGACPGTSYMTYQKIHQLPAPIFLTILRHARSDDLPEPICIYVQREDEVESLYTNFGTFSTDFRNAINIDPKNYETPEARDGYWRNLNALNGRIVDAVEQLRKFLFPWTFLFRGIPTSPALDEYKKIAFPKIDQMCARYDFPNNKQVVLSLLAVHVAWMSTEEVQGVIHAMIFEKNQRSVLLRLFHTLKIKATRLLKSKNEPVNPCSTNFPCILVIDERLDHFFWEEINSMQEFTRVSTMQLLYYLYNWHKDNIRNGYLHMDITDGACLINPDKDLPKSEKRLKAFFDYWTPHWEKVFGEKPTQAKSENLLGHSCFFYAGHGSGLQYINGKQIAQLKVKGVVFLFGCDSSRMRSNGLFSELTGPQLYYHAAKCPTMVGTILPGLDANMDTVATEVISKWIAPNTKDVLPWNAIDRTVWIRTSEIKYEKDDKNPPTMAKTKNYLTGSLGAVIAYVHRCGSEKKYYNTCSYVIRGLPVWNVNVEKFPY